MHHLWSNFMPVIFIFCSEASNYLWGEGNWSGLLVEINYSLVCYIFPLSLRWFFTRLTFFLIISWLLTGVMGFFWVSTHTIVTAGLCLLFEMVRRFFFDLLFSCFRFCTWIGMTIMEGNLHRLISFRSSSLLASPISL